MTTNRVPAPWLPRAHRAAGLVLAAPLVLWVATGLLFHVKYRYAEAYEVLRAPLPGPLLWDRTVFSPAALYARGLFDPGTEVRLAPHPRGLVVYFGRKGSLPAAIDGASGEPVPVADEETARLWATGAVSASPNAARYGSAGAGEPGTHRSALTGVDDPAFAFRYSGGKRVVVDRVTGEVSQTGRLNDWIDLTYEVHYLKWTSWKPLDVGLVLAAVPGVLFLAASGLALSRRGRD